MCVACRARVCVECATKVEGINYCVRCLAQLAGAEARALEGASDARDAPPSVVAPVVAGVVFYLALWILVQLAFPEAA